MKTGFFLVSLLIIILQACTKEAPIKHIAGGPGSKGHATTYLIRKGNHYAEQNNVQLLPSQEINVEVLFDSSAIYASLNPENQLDVNKLIGFSDCNTGHQENSARIGWSWNGRKVNLYAYVYVNKERLIKNLATVPLNEPVRCVIKAAGNHYYFTTGNYTDSLPRHCSDYKGNSYKLYPYFGGDETAPHDISIKIKEN